MYRKMSVFLVLLLITSGFVGLLNGDSLEVTEEADIRSSESQFLEYTPRTPIRINGNDDFTSANGVSNPDAEGNETDPYIIEGYEIDGGGYGYCIYIGNTTDHFVVRDNYLHNASGNPFIYRMNSGIYLYNVNNGTLDNNTLVKNELYGVYIESSDNNVLKNNTAWNNTSMFSGGPGFFLMSSEFNVLEGNNASENFNGIHLVSSHNNELHYNNASHNKYGITLTVSEHNLLTNNTANYNAWDGDSYGYDLEESGNNMLIDNYASSNLMGAVLLDRSFNNTLTGNEMVSNGIFIAGENIEHWNSHHIDDINTVSGKPVYYWKNKDGGTVPTGSGQVIIVNSTRVTVRDQVLNDGTAGILLGFSNGNTFSYNNASNNILYGIYVRYSNDNMFTNNIFSHNGDSGVSLEYNSNGNLFYNNNFINNTYGATDWGENIWNASYPTGGNYWSDYNGYDNFSGPNQDQPGGDGIGDTTYSIVNGIGVDEYPLMEPWSMEINDLANTGWPCYQHDTRHTGRSEVDTSFVDGTEKWNTTISDYIDEGISIGFEDTLYVAGYRDLTALDSDGNILWTFNSSADHTTSGTPAVASDGTIYVPFDYWGTNEALLYALYPDNGTEKWCFDLNPNGVGGTWQVFSPVIGNDGTIYSASNHDVLYAINPNGTERWNTTVDPGMTAPAIGDDKTIYVTAYGSALTAIYPNGTVKWRFRPEGWHDEMSSPSIGEDGTIYYTQIGEMNETLYAVNPDGTEKWNYTWGGGNYLESPPIAQDGTIYLKDSMDEKLIAIDEDGMEKWNFSVIPTDGPPAIGGNGTIYMAGYDKIYGINPDGTEKWNTSSIDRVTATAIDSTGHLYMANGEFKTVYKFGAKDIWPTFRHDNKHTGRSPYNTSHVDGTERWRFDLGSRGESSPAIGDDGTIYIGSGSTMSYNNKLFAVTKDGKERWNFTTGDIILSSPAIDSGGTVYAGCHDGKLYAVNPNGTEKWNLTLGGGIVSSPVVDSNGVIYIGGGVSDSNLYAVNPNGTIKWTFHTDHDVRSSPAIGTDGTIYVGSYDYKLYAVYPNGTQRWNYTTNGRIYSSPAIGDDGTIYIGSRDENLYAIYSNGTKKWNYTINGEIWSSPAIGIDDTIYIGSYKMSDNRFYAIYSNGTKRWDYGVKGSVFSSAAIGGDGTVYIGSAELLYAFKPEGGEKWNFSTGLDIESSPAIGVDGTIYVSSYDNDLYAITGGYDIDLTSGGASDGWNFISLPYEPHDTDLMALLDDPDNGIAGNYDKVMYYSALEDTWKTFIPGREDHYNNLDEVNHKMGFWIHMANNETLTVLGSPPSSTTVKLEPGWNMVGYPSSKAGSGVPAEVTKIGYFDATAEYNVAYDHDPANFTFEPGQGYWMYNGADSTVTWVVEY
ncbi:MAG: PQQ-binding-like beta-propeller repeat protein [Thermoplasmata archaeon]